MRAESFEQGVERGVRQGIAQGRAEGGAHVIGLLAALKFGSGTAAHLAGLLEGRANQENLDKVGRWILECESGSELLSRVSGLLAKTSE